MPDDDDCGIYDDPEAVAEMESQLYQDWLFDSEVKVEAE